MKKTISTINRENIESLLINKEQNEVSLEMELFASKVPLIEKLEDLRTLDKIFYSYFKSDKTTPKFECTSAEIFERKTYSGCSDIGLAFAPILRMKGIPTVYVESAQIEWIKDVQEDNEEKEFMRGHIFLEIYLNSTWYLYDPTFHLVYDNYNCENLFLPRGFVVFAKSLNCHELGVHNVQDEKKIGTSAIKEFDITEYEEPNYEVIDLRKIDVNKTDK